MTNHDGFGRNRGQLDVPLPDLDFAVVDLETTGWSPQHDGITEVGAVLLHGGRVRGEYAMLVDPGAPVPPGIEELTGIADWMLAKAPPLRTVLPGLLRFIQGRVFIAHNAPFDVGFLTAACQACELPWPDFTVLDTVMLARGLLEPDEVPDRKLSTLAAFFHVRAAPSHRALADARATAGVLRSLLGRLAVRDIRTLAELLPWLAGVEAEAARAETAAREAEARARENTAPEPKAASRATAAGPDVTTPDVATPDVTTPDVATKAQSAA